MFAPQRTIFAFLLGYGRSLASDIADARFADQPFPGANHPAWQFGHLAFAADASVGLLGGTALLPKRWALEFGPKSIPRPDRASYPAKSELIATWEAAHARLDEAAGNANPDRLSQPHGMALGNLAITLPTVADLVTHVMTSHEGMHLGQLSYWRRQSGSAFLA